MIRFLTSGESHGPALTAVVEGLPAGIKLDSKQITLDLRRRQLGHGRGARMRIEKDTALLVAGVWQGKTIGSPVSVLIQNRDWRDRSSKKGHRQMVPRPGHADLPGLLKYDLDDIQKVIERASARETAARVAVGSVAKQYLACFGVKVFSHTRRIGSVANDKPVSFSPKVFKAVETSPVRCADAAASTKMVLEIDRAAAAKDTVGGISEVVIAGAPVGLGSYAHWDRRLDSRLAAALMAVQSVKAVEIGSGIAASSSFGSQVHDPVAYNRSSGFTSPSNNAGGVIGGVSTGQEIICRAFFKPISTLGAPLESVNVRTKKSAKAPVIRSDICIVPAGGVVCEAVAALVVADLMSEKFGGDSIREAMANFETYRKHVRAR